MTSTYLLRRQNDLSQEVDLVGVSVQHRQIDVLVAVDSMEAWEMCLARIAICSRCLRQVKASELR